MYDYFRSILKFVKTTFSYEKRGKLIKQEVIIVTDKSHNIK